MDTFAGFGQPCRIVFFLFLLTDTFNNEINKKIDTVYHWEYGQICKLILLIFSWNVCHFQKFEPLGIKMGSSLISGVKTLTTWSNGTPCITENYLSHNNRDHTSSWQNEVLVKVTLVNEIHIYIKGTTGHIHELL